MNRLLHSAFSQTVELLPDELVDAASMTLLEVDVLSAKGGLSRIRKTGSPGGWTFDTAALNAHVRARGAFQKDHVVVLTVMRGGDASICGVPLDDGMILVLPDGAEITASIRNAVVYSASVLPVDTWAGIVDVATGGAEPAIIEQAHALRQSPEAFALMAKSLTSAIASFDRQEDAGTEMPGPYIDYLGAVASSTAGPDEFHRRLSRSSHHRQKQAWLAEELIHAKLHEPLSVMGICREVRVSRRQLEYAFQTTFGIGPREYLRLLRLNESRRQLKSGRAGSRTVTDIAMGVGITHLSRFAQSYRTLFGETPLQTLRGGGN
ncbi:MAG: helix-turn-helix domain-containing protein [Mesorhizobium sp.]|nr:helix-turn-helix domain-containing protein [Mesorhizobium sp.]MBL8580118.1 helix-turn-helix domain-containing protein [Mesorhizobium sp.]